MSDMRRLSRLHPHYGYRRITALLRAEGRRVNRKRAHRLWRLEGLKVLGKRRRGKRLGTFERPASRWKTTGGAIIATGRTIR